MKIAECPYRVGQLVYAQFITDDWLLAKIVARNVRKQRIKLRNLTGIGGSYRRYHDRIRILTPEEEMLLRLEIE